MESFKDITKTITRSDGSTKIYGHTQTGDLLTVVMVKNICDGNWSITEIAKSGRVTHMFSAR